MFIWSLKQQNMQSQNKLTLVYSLHGFSIFPLLTYVEVLKLSKSVINIEYSETSMRYYRFCYNHFSSQ